MTDARGRPKVPLAGDSTEAAQVRGDSGPEPEYRVAEDAEAVVRRTKNGWRVGGADLPDLTSAMVLADLLSAEFPGTEPTGTEPTGTGPSGTTAPASTGRPGAQPAGTGSASTEPSAGKGPADAGAASETSRLRATIGQLEHALTARIRVEQAIGVLAERHRIQPRQAFEQLRAAARSRGRRVIDIATDVVASATNPLLQLPDELSRPRSTGRRGRQARGVLGSE